MNPHPPSSRLPGAALAEFVNFVESDWDAGIPLTELLNRVNLVVAGFIPKNQPQGSPVGRVKQIFTERGFRHYQTCRCIDPPGRHGRFAAYGYRHFVQALLVRRLLWERVPSEQIVVMMAGRTTEEIQHMFIEGVEIVAKPWTKALRTDLQVPASADREETWKRIRISPGIELHVRSDLPRPRPELLGLWLEQIEGVLVRLL